MKVAVCLILAFLSLIMNGCATEIEKPTLEDLGFIGVLGFDYVDGNRMKITASLPQPSQHAKEKTQVYSTISDLPAAALMMLTTKSEKTMVFSQLRAVLFSEEFARKAGLRKVVTNLYRHPSVGDNVFVAIVKGSAEELINAKYENKPEFNTYLNDLLRPRKETAFHSFTSIHDFIYNLTNMVSDPNLPYLERKDGDIQITKTALLKEDKLVGLLNQQEGKILQMLANRSQLPDMEFHIKEDKESKKTAKAVLQPIQSEAKHESNGNVKAPLIKIRLHIRGSVVGYSGNLDLNKPEQQHRMELAMEREIITQAEALIRKLTRLEVEPSGFMEAVRQRYPGKWNQRLREQALQHAKVEVHADIEIVGSGTIK